MVGNGKEWGSKKKEKKRKEEICAWRIREKGK